MAPVAAENGFVVPIHACYVYSFFGFGDVVGLVGFWGVCLVLD